MRIRKLDMSAGGLSKLHHELDRIADKHGIIEPMPGMPYLEELDEEDDDNEQ